MNHPHSRIALITGASGGIGHALAHEFAKGGYGVVLAARSAGKLEVLATELRSRFKVQATVMAADLETPDGAQKLHADVKGRGLTLSVLANNAGYGTFGEFKDSDLAAQLAMMQLNMGTVVALTRLFLPDLLATRGKLLNVASTAAFQPGPYMAVYFASKAFVLSFSEALAAELDGSGVAVTALCPGATQSGFEQRADMGRSALFKGRKLPTSEDVAAAGYAALQRGQRVYVHGAMNRVMAQAIRFTPRRMATTIAKRITRPV
jgi:uncharacterized protein